MIKRINNKRYNKLLSYRNNYFAPGGDFADEYMQQASWGIHSDSFPRSLVSQPTLNATTKQSLTEVLEPQGFDALQPFAKRSMNPEIFEGMPNANQAMVKANMSSGSQVAKTPNFFQKIGSNIGESFKSGALNGAISAAGSAVGGAIGGKLESGAGKVMNGLSNIASALPGPWGKVAGAGLNIVGGLTNRMFGTKFNTANIKAIEQETNKLNNFQSDANSFDTLSKNWGSAALGADIKDDAVGSAGWFAHGKIADKANQLRKSQAQANAFVENSLLNNAENLNEDTLNNLESNYAAYGGFLNRYDDMANRYDGGGYLNTHGANFSNGFTYINEGGSHESNPYEGVYMGMGNNGKPNLVEEGEVIYNDYVFSNRLTVPKSIRSKYKLKGNKELTFADGVKQLTKGIDERPNDPISEDTIHDIMMDLAQTQEGIKAKEQQKMQRKLGIQPNQAGAITATQQPQDTQAVTPEQAAQVEQPNYSAYGGNLYDDGGWAPTEINKYKAVDNYFGYNQPTWMNEDKSYKTAYTDFINNSYTKDLFRQHLKDQFNYYDNATDEQKKSNRYLAIDYFIKSNPDWYNNRSTIDTWNISEDLYRQGKNLALSNPGFMHPEYIVRAALEGNEGNEATASTTEPLKKNRYFLRSTDANGNLTVTPMKVTPWEGFAGKGQQFEGQTFAEAFPEHVFKGKQERPIDNNIIYTDYYYDENKPVEEKKKEDLPPLDLGTADESMRYAPVAGLGALAITDALGLTNKPDYSEAAILQGASSGSYKPVGWRPIGNMLTYKPFDRDFYTNKLSAEAGATRRALENQSGGNSGKAMAGLLAADYNAQNQLGELFRKAEEYNLEQRQKVEDFNRATNMANSEGMLKADMANQSAYANARDLAFKGAASAAEMMQKERLASEAAKSANLSGLFQTIGDIGYENKNMNMIRRLAETGALGAISEGHPEWWYLASPSQKKAYRKSQKNSSTNKRV